MGQVSKEVDTIASRYPADRGHSPTTQGTEFSQQHEATLKQIVPQGHQMEPRPGDNVISAI